MDEASQELDIQIRQTTSNELQQTIDSFGHIGPQVLSDVQRYRRDRYDDMLYRPSYMPFQGQGFVQERGLENTIKNFHLTNIDPETTGTVYEIQPGTYIILNSEGLPLGGVHKSIFADENEYIVPLQDIRSVLTQEGTPIPASLNDVELTSAVSWIYRSTHPDATTESEGQLRDITAKSLPLEYLLHTYELIKNYPELQKSIMTFVQDHQIDGLVALWGVDSSKEFHRLQDMMKQNDSNVSFFLDFFTANAQMEDLYQATLGMTDQMQALHGYLHQKERSMIKTVIQKWGTHTFTWKPVALGLMGLRDVLFDVLAFTKDSGDAPIPYIQELTDLILDNAGDEQALIYASPAIERRWIAQMKKLQPGEYEKAAAFFYDKLRPTLTEQADASTGDTKKELDRLKRITDWLVSHHMIPTDGSLRYADFGCGDGKRILLPYLNWLSERGIEVGAVDAIDLLDQPIPKNRAMRFIQANLSDPNLQLSDVQGNPATYHLITGSWSLLTDQDPQGQIDMLRVMAHHLTDDGIGIIDVPTFDTYQQTIDAYHQEHPDEPKGVFTREFYLADGSVISKKFYVPPPIDLPIQLLTCGLKLITEYGKEKSAVISDVPYRYITSSGQERMTVVFQKYKKTEIPEYQFIGNSQNQA
jgi:hypothetical protein